MLTEYAVVDSSIFRRCRSFLARDYMQWTDRLGRRVNLRQLHILMAVVQAGSIAKAATALSISHPVVSKTISDLEYALGVCLLERSSRGVAPTMHGRACLDCAVAVFDELRRGIQKIELLSDPTKGEVRVGGSEPMMADFIPSVIDQLVREYPRIAFHSLLGDGKELHSALRGRQVDLIISRSLPPVEDDLVAEVLFEENLFVVSGLQSQWAGRRKIDLAELANVPWVMPDSENVIGPLIVEGFHTMGVAPPKGQVVSNSLAVRAKLAANGQFVTILPGSMLYRGAERLSLKILPVSLPIRSRPVEIITLKSRALSPVALLFVKAVRAAAKNLLTGRASKTLRPRHVDKGLCPETKCLR
jgi:DNA-binding transcriptional LysR family regulator